MDILDTEIEIARIMTRFEDYVVNTPLIRNNPVWRKEADDALDALRDLFNNLGGSKWSS